MKTTIKGDLLLSEIIGLINQVIIVTDNQNKFIYVSPNSEKILGIKSKDIETKNYLQNFLPTLKINWQELLTYKQITNLEIEIQDQLEQTLYLVVDIKLFNEEKNQIIYLIQNITKTKKIEDNLFFSEKMYANLANNLPIGIFRLDNKGNCRFANPKACEILGKNNQEPFMEFWLKNIVSEDQEKIFSQLAETLNTGKIWQAEYKYQYSPRIIKSLFTQCVSEINPIGETNYVGIIMDFTERKQAEEKLKESEDKFKATFEQAAVGIAHVATDGSWLNVNQQLCDIVGYTREELLKLTFQDITYHEDLETDLNYVNSCLKGEINTYSMDKRYIKKGGDIIWIHLTVSLLKDNFGKPKYFISVVKDINENKQIELKLKESEERFRNAIENAPFPIMLHAEDGKVIKINQIWTDITGYEYQEINTISKWTKKAYDKKMKLVKSKINNLYSITKTIDQGEYNITTATGEKRVWNFSSTPLGKLPDGRKLIMSMAMDITIRKKAEEAYLKLNEELEKRVEERTLDLQKSQEFLQLIIDNIPQYIFWKDRHSIYLGCNKNFAQILGLKSPQEIIGKNDYDLPFLKEEADFYREWDYWVMEHNQPRYHIIETATINKHKIWADTCKVPLYNSDNNVIGILGTYEDISEKKQLEEKLKLAQFTLDKIGDAIFFVQENANFFYVNEAAYQRLGYTKEELLALKIINIDTLFLNFSAKNWLLFWQNLIENKVLIIESFYRHKNGKNFPVEISMFSLNFENNIYACVVARDITNRKKVEQELKDSEERYRLMATNSSDMISRHSPKGVYLYASPACRTLLGYNPNELVGKTAYNFIHPDDIPQIKISHQSLLAKSIVNSDIYRIKHKNGQYIWFETSSKTVRDQNSGTIIEIIAISRDITARKETQLALQESEKRYRRIVETSNEGIWVIDANNNTSFVNEKMAEMLGYSVEEMMGKSLFYFMDEEGKIKAKINLQYRRLGLKQQHDFKFTRKDGSILWCLISTSPILDDNGNYEGALGMIVDITERIKIEQALRYSEERFRIALKNSPIVVFNQDANLRYTWIYNSDLGLKPEQIIGKVDYDIYLEKDAQKLTLLKRQVLSTQKGIRKEILIGNNDNIKYYDLTIDPLFDLKGNIEGITCASLDITEHKQAEIKIKQSLEEKEVLLKEIHHRVKNNLYVISSLLNLQSSYFNDPKIITCFQDSQNRIQSMAMIHEQLYRSENLASINFSNYINQLISSLFSSYNSQLKTIKSIINLESIHLKIEIAIPCGLLINELITNSFKHAFHNKQSGEIKLELYRSNDQKIHLIVSDNGDGLPDDLDWENSNSLGLRLVHILTQQIEANLDLQTSPKTGTSYHFVLE